jgi:hypothetical protein
LTDVGAGSRAPIERGIRATPSKLHVSVVPANVQSMMIEYDRRARHYEVVDDDA